MHNGRSLSFKSVIVFREVSAFFSVSRIFKSAFGHFRLFVVCYKIFTETFCNRQTRKTTLELTAKINLTFRS